MDPSEHLFRREAGRMVATLTRIFGVHNLALAEDVVQDAFCRALEVWKFRGMPENPSAWLMSTAKNRALDVLRRERTARTFAPALSQLRLRMSSLRVSLPSTARFTCYSTKATMAHRPRHRCASSCAAKQCGLRRCCWNTRSEERRRHTRRLL